MRRQSVTFNPTRVPEPKAPMRYEDLRKGDLFYFDPPQDREMTDLKVKTDTGYTYVDGGITGVMKMGKYVYRVTININGIKEVE